MKHAAQILAETFGWDIADARECRYQPTRTKLPVFTVGDHYYAVSKTKPSFDGMNWREHGDQFFAKQSGTILWVADAGSGVAK